MKYVTYVGTSHERHLTVDDLTKAGVDLTKHDEGLLVHEENEVPRLQFKKGEVVGLTNDFAQMLVNWGEFDFRDEPPPPVEEEPISPLTGEPIAQSRALSQADDTAKLPKDEAEESSTTD